MTEQEFFKRCGYNMHGPNTSGSALPCFAHRVSVNGSVNTPALIKYLIAYSVKDSNNDVLVFSVTEKDTCWDAWSKYAKAHPRTFKVIEGGSIHGRYMCRMYIYTKPATKRKFGDKKGK